MNEQLTNSIFRLITIISLLKTEGGFQIIQLSEYLDVPLRIIRGDIDALMQIDPEKIYVYFDNDTIMDAFSEDKLSFRSALLKGMFDNEYVCAMEDNNNDNVGLVLSNSQLNILGNFLNLTEYATRYVRTDSLFLTKNNHTRIKRQHVDWKVLIETRIKENKSVRITYKNHRNEIDVKDIRPVKILHNTDTNQIYLVDSENVIRRFDRILRVEYSKAEIEVDPEKTLNWDKIWGMELNDTSTHVKIKIFDEEIIKKDFENKEDKITFQDGYYIYEDDIIGINAFRSWINSQGPNVVVLEPLELRERVLKSIRDRQEWYDKTNI